MTEDKPTTAEIAESMTGYEEIGIEKAFGADATELGGNKPLRALGFVLFKRQGQDHDLAYASVMSLGLRDVLALFGDDVEEVFPDEPDSASGKDDSQPVSVPPPSPVGV